MHEELFPKPGVQGSPLEDAVTAGPTRIQAQFAARWDADPRKKAHELAAHLLRAGHPVAFVVQVGTSLSSLRESD